MKTNWTAADIPDLTGKVAIVTGANIGLGLEIAKQLALHNATVVMACRTTSKAEKARDEQLAKELSKEQMSRLDIMKIDTSSFESVHEFADEFKMKYERLDILMCNAGVMALQERAVSKDGYELQFATNHLGHFLLTGLLLELLQKTEDSRLVAHSSSANWFGKLNFDDLNAEDKYAPWDQYSMTKLANVCFAKEFNVRNEGNANPKAFSANPGYVVGQLQHVQANGNKFLEALYGLTRLFASSVQTGALQALYACTGPSEDMKAGEFYGPDGWFNGLFGGDHPKALKPNDIANDKQQTERLWNISEELTKFKYQF